MTCTTDDPFPMKDRGCGTLPKVSIGLPVYNGERYLRESIESVLAQDFPDFELLISDNASTDGTWDICQSYAANDNRVRIHRHDCNRGALPNYDFVFQNTSAPYFMWHAHDDVLRANYLSSCVGFLDLNPEYVACGSPVTYLDASGSVTSSVQAVSDIMEHDECQRFYTSFERTWECPHLFYALFRRSVMNTVLPLPCVDGADFIVSNLVALQGKCHQSTETTRYYRENTARTYTSEDEALRHYVVTLQGPTAKYRAFPHLRMAGVLAMRVMKLDKPLGSRLRLAGSIFRHRAAWKRWVVADVGQAGVALLLNHPRLYRKARNIWRFVTSKQLA